MRANRHPSVDRIDGMAREFTNEYSIASLWRHAMKTSARYANASYVVALASCACAYVGARAAKRAREREDDARRREELEITSDTTMKREKMR